MKKKYAVLGLMMFSVTSVWATNPCMSIAQACTKAGFYKGGDTVGQGLMINCVLPIANKQKMLPGTNFDDNMLQQCKMLLVAVMK
ncbi:hypothetical protein N9Q05_02560, partial [bacterium]|nr:hypothetical protein [bacterium]